MSLCLRGKLFWPRRHKDTKQPTKEEKTKRTRRNRRSIENIYKLYRPKGALRLCRVNEDGTEPIVLSALDGRFIAYLYSFLTAEPFTYNIDAIEDSKLVLITPSASDELRKHFSKYQEFIFQANSEAYSQLERRITLTIIPSLEERYQD